MAYVDQNDITNGLRGKLGKQFVFRKYGRSTLATRRAVPTGGPTSAQLAYRERFRQATFYAKRVLRDPQLRAEYQAIARAKEQQSVSAVAIGDFLKPVAITKVSVLKYPGEPGFALSVQVNDKHKVKALAITVIEQGRASTTDRSQDFFFISATSRAHEADIQVEIEVSDRPGNIVLERVSLVDYALGSSVS